MASGPLSNKGMFLMEVALDSEEVVKIINRI